MNAQIRASEVEKNVVFFGIFANVKNPKSCVIMSSLELLRKGVLQLYQLGDLVTYGIHGVCRIVDRVERTVDRKKMVYLVLEPQGQKASQYLVPEGNPNAMAKLRPVLSKEELETLLASDIVREDAWIEEENLRKQHYRTLVNSGDRAALLRMVRTLRLHKQRQEAAGRKFHQCDEAFLRDAQRLIDSEFAVVLGIEPADVGEYVMDRMNA